MRILFCGTNLEPEWETRLKYLSLAGNRFQNNFIGAVKRQGQSLFGLTFVGIPLSAQEKDAVFQLGQKADSAVVLKQKNLLQTVLSYQKRMKAELKRADIVIAYNIVYPWLGLAKAARRRGVKSIVILADYSGMESYKSLARKAYAWLMLKEMQRFDLVVGLSENIGQKLRRGQQFICMEGGIDLSAYQDCKPLPVSEDGKLRIMYAGVLNEVTGIPLLLQAIERIKNPKAEFIFTGRGEWQEQILAAAKKDGRIHFYGSLEYTGYLKELKNSHILVNPRNMKLPENQNNFPSKIMEYLAAGRVIVSTKYAGWKKFDKTAYFCNSEINDLAEKIERAVLDYDTVYQAVFSGNRERAKEFDWSLQTEKILAKTETFGK